MWHTHHLLDSSSCCIFGQRFFLKSPVVLYTVDPEEVAYLTESLHVLAGDPAKAVLGLRPQPTLPSRTVVSFGLAIWIGRENFFSVITDHTQAAALPCVVLRIAEVAKVATLKATLC